MTSFCPPVLTRRNSSLVNVQRDRHSIARLSDGAMLSTGGADVKQLTEEAKERERGFNSPSTWLRT